MRTTTFILFLSAVFASTSFGQDEPKGYALVGGEVHPMTSPVIPDGVVLIKGSKIEAVGPRSQIKIPAGYKVIEARGRPIIPGLVEMHNHTLASDLHDNALQVNPELRVLDNLTLNTDAAKFAVAGGVTTVLTIPGSGSNMGGFGVIQKTFGERPEEVLVRYPGALKIAQAGNPEQGDGDLGAGPMGMNWLIRDVLTRGLDYHKAWESFERGETKIPPARHPRYEPLRGLFRGEYPAAVHTQQMQVVQSTWRIVHDELGIDVVIDHGTFDGYLNAPELVKRQIPVANGPREFWYDRTQGRFIGLAAAWYWLGLRDNNVSVNTDAPVVPQEELIFQLSMSVRMGLPEEKALSSLTIGTARMLKIDHRVGSLEVGKDADIAMWTGDPLDPRHRTQIVFVNGKVAYDADRDGIRF
jgi:imidazolonepropionase-like amidohydrolase